MQQKRILILTVSAGGGHVAAGRALEAAFRELAPQHAVKTVDALDYTSALFRRIYAKAYIDLVDRAPTVLGWLYDHLDKPWKNERRRLALDRLNAGRFIQLLERENPDVAVSTHFLPSEILSWLKAKKCVRSPQAVVVTDLDVHAMWLARNVELYCVAREETRVHLQQLGVAADRAAVTGIPIHPRFAEKKDRPALRAKHGLRADLPVVLVAAGGYGVGPIERMIQILRTAATPMQIVALCGKGEDLRRRLEAKGPPRGSRVVLKAVGFTTEMDEYMAAADLLISKAGGLTTSEALASGLPMLIVNPIPGQEERNADHLLQEGCAERCNNLPVLAWRVDRLLGDPGKLSSMRAAAAVSARPRAAHEIVERVLRLAE